MMGGGKKAMKLAMQEQCHPPEPPKAAIYGQSPGMPAGRLVAFATIAGPPLVRGLNRHQA
ncbi:MAG: hypothetical protein CVU31_18935 [Betaproteobacteria bacterium HGW-Betaproteobacteria-4]|nr:MAG: hypothetical protein CVU31_18935 [Betaproteobacteria bacterium HGW-Betaproteobacteria-4]